MIYFIKSESGHVKIGYSENGVENRLQTLQCGCPFKLSLLKAIEFDRLQESLIHNKFKKYRCQGEWFALCPELEKYIENPYPLPDTLKRRSQCTKRDKGSKSKDSLALTIQEFLTSHNMKPYHFSQAAGINPSQLSRFLNDKGGLNWETAKKIIGYIDALGVPAKELLE